MYACAEICNKSQMKYSQNTEINIQIRHSVTSKYPQITLNVCVFSISLGVAESAAVSILMPSEGIA